MSTIKLSEGQWNDIYQRIANEYREKPSVLIITEVRKRELGFSVRRHRFWVPERDEYEEQIHLDFTDREMATWFRLKYL